MKSYLDLVPLSQKVHKKQSRMVRLCIILSVFLITAIFGMADMEIRSQKAQAQINYGKWHAGFRNMSDEEAVLIGVRPKVLACTRYDTLNYRLSMHYQIDGNEAVLIGFDEDALDIFPTAQIVEGTFPSEEGTALVDGGTKERLSLKLGDEISLTSPDGSQRPYRISGFTGKFPMLARQDVYGLMLSTEEFRKLFLDGSEDNHDSFLYVSFSPWCSIQKEIRDIQEQKEKEARQLRANETDGVSGLYSFSAGMKYVREQRSTSPEGVMVNLLFDGIRQAGTKCGIVFSDMILEEIGCLIKDCCEKSGGETGLEPLAFRLNADEFVLWLGGYTKAQATGLVRELSGKIDVYFGPELFSIDTYAGFVRTGAGQDTQEVIRMARLTRRIADSQGKEGDMFYRDIPADQCRALPALQGRDIHSAGYGEDIGLVSVALNLFSKGGGFASQMMLMCRKIGRFYQAQGVLVSLLRADFNSNYLNCQWHRDGSISSNTVRKYKEEEKEAFYRWLGQKEVRSVSPKDSGEDVVQRFLCIEEGDFGVVLPMYESGSYMGNICILGILPEFLEDSENYQELAELGRVVESQLNQQQSDIASKAKSEFLSRMSHEIRTPMNGIIGMTAIALQQGQSRERAIDCLQKIQSSSQYLLGLINDILDMSKIESGKMKLEPCNFSIYEMLDTIGELIAPQAQAKQIDFVKEIRISHKWFWADRMRISQVLINLLGNAVKFTPVRGKVILSVEELEGDGERAGVCFAVSDTGIGIAQEDQERVFRSFGQASSNPSKQQGTGLGLSISSRLVQLMGSNIQIESQPGEGSTFRFMIPISLGEDMEMGASVEEVSFEGRRVLVVEDNELNSEIAQCLLEERGFEVDCVYNGAEAVEQIKNKPPGTYDVILMDIMMPVMDGLEATRAIRGMEREDCHTIPIVAMSANAFDDDLKKSVECGMNGHLSKPVDVEKLYQTLGEIILAK